jgi:hypothetical protein
VSARTYSKAVLLIVRSETAHLLFVLAKLHLLNPFSAVLLVVDQEARLLSI